MFRWISNNLAPLTLLGAVLAYVQPPLFLIFKDSIAWMFAITMFALGIVIDADELNEALHKPKAIALGVFSQYTIMPLLALLVVTLTQLPAELALGFILVGSAPGAMASNMIVYLAGGAVAFSVSLTTVATLLSPILTPFLVQQLGGAFMHIDFMAMTVKILLTVVIPLLLGLLARRFLGVFMGVAKQLAPAAASLAIVIICAFVVAANRDRLGQLGPLVIVLVICMNALGYMLGWWAAKMYGFDRQHRLTLSIEVGMQNAGMGVLLATTQFQDQPAVALPAALFAFWCVLTAAGATGYFRFRAKSG